MIALMILACSVAADATAVAIAASVRGMNPRRGMMMAFSFGAAQSVMAGLGWIGGAFLGRTWREWDHWIALALLTVVGLKMIKEAFEDEDQSEHGAGTLLLLTVATSIDALAVGVTLPAMTSEPLLALTLIGAVTFLFSAAGATFGKFVGERFGKTVEVAGGVALIGLGIKIVIEHLG